MDNEAGVTVFVGATDIGQGSCTVMSQMAAEVLGVDYMDINIICQDTTLAPMDNGTYDSRVTYGAGHAVKRAAEQVAGKLKDWAAVQMGVRPEHLALGQNEIYSTYDEKKRMSLSDAVAGYHNSVGPLFGEGEYTPPQPKGKYPGNLIGPSPAFGFTAQIAEVDVELDTGRVRVTTFHDAGDCGQPINPLSVEGQVEGGVSMGLGQALYEQMIIGPDGRMLNANLRDYKIVTARDMPEVKTYYIDSYDPTAPFGNKETGEGPTCGVIPAVLAAIEDAIGVRFTEIPVTPEKVLAALGKIKGV
jgi:4-hydroxybenzoyl-CoA reductase subunit alpha